LGPRAQDIEGSPENGASIPPFAAYDKFRV
jgi:hypothetical protein